jgi:hypothetical protein
MRSFCNPISRPLHRRLRRPIRTRRLPARCRRYVQPRCRTRPHAKKVEGRAVIGYGAPFEAQPGNLGVQGWSQAPALSKLSKRVRLEKTQARGKSCDGFSISRAVCGGKHRNDQLRLLSAGLLPQLVLQAILQFGADFADFHAGADQELAAQKFMRAVFIREFSDHAAILAVLIPAETPVRDRFRADVLKAAKNRILLRDLKGFAHNLDFDKSFVGAKNLSAARGGDCFRHRWSRLL